MAFVHEKIAAQDLKIDFTSINSGFGRVLSMPSQWVIDRDRQAFLIWLEQESELPYAKFFALSWRGKVFNVVVSDVEARQQEGGELTLTQKIQRVYAPGDKSIGREELDQAAVLALEALLVWTRRLASTYNGSVDAVRV